MSALFGNSPFFPPLNTILSDGLGDALKKRAVWKKASPILGEDPDHIRLDATGYQIYWSEYGNRDSAYGWELDHWPVPKSLGGSDDISNLRPLNWLMNCAQGNRSGVGGLLDL